MKTSLTQRIAGALALALASAAPALAQAYPSKPITLVVPFSAGAGTDQVARAMANHMQVAFSGATVVVENKSGASGLIAAQAVAKAAPDGYTLLMTTNTTQSANPHLFKKLPYDPVGDFAPIAAVARGSMVLALPVSSPIQSVADFIAEGKKRVLTFGAGNSSSRVAAEMFSQLTGAKVLYVPYKSNPQAVTDLVGGQFDFMFGDTVTALPLVKSGNLKALAYTGDKRSPVLPNVPTLVESGVKGYELYYWVAVYAPKGTPRDVIARLNQAFVSGAKSDAVGAVYHNALLEPFTTTPEELATFQRTETEKWGRVIKAAGIQAE